MQKGKKRKIIYIIFFLFFFLSGVKKKVEKLSEAENRKSINMMMFV